MKLLILILMAESAFAGEATTNTCWKCGNTPTNYLFNAVINGKIVDKRCPDCLFGKEVKPPTSDVIDKDRLNRPQTPAGAPQETDCTEIGCANAVHVYCWTFGVKKELCRYHFAIEMRAPAEVFESTKSSIQWEYQAWPTKTIRETNVVDRFISDADCTYCDGYRARRGLSVSWCIQCRNPTSEETATVREITLLKFNGTEHRIATNVISTTKRRWRKAEVKEYID